MRISVLLLLCSLPLIAAQAARADSPSKAEQTRLFFGKDERIKVTDTAAQPWQAIGSRNRQRQSVHRHADLPARR